MRTSERDFGTGPEFSPEDLKFVTSRDIWLALDDNHCDSMMKHSTRPFATEPVRCEDIENYQRQLFFWLLIRGGPCVFPEHAELRHGVPARCKRKN